MTPREWAANLSMPSLLIVSDSDTGLVPGELHAIEEFVRLHGSEPKAGETAGL